MSNLISQHFAVQLICLGDLNVLQDFISKKVTIIVVKSANLHIFCHQNIQNCFLTFPKVLKSDHVEKFNDSNRKQTDNNEKVFKIVKFDAFIAEDFNRDLIIRSKSKEKFGLFSGIVTRCLFTSLKSSSIFQK